MEPVGVARTTPSQPKAVSGELSTETTTSSIRSRWDFSTEASLRAHVRATSRPSTCTTTSRAMRSITT